MGHGCDHVFLWEGQRLEVVWAPPRKYEVEMGIRIQEVEVEGQQWRRGRVDGWLGLRAR